MIDWKRLFSSVRIWILVIIFLMFLIALRPNPFAEGVVIKGVVRDSSAALSGIKSPSSHAVPSSLERIKSINGKAVASVAEYFDIVDNIGPNRTVQIVTTTATYRMLTKPVYETVLLEENETVMIPETVLENVTINGTAVEQNTTINKTVTRPKTQNNIIGVEPLGLTVAPAPITNLRKGLDLQGGTRVLLMPDEEVAPGTIDIMVDSLKQRLNVFGLSDISVTPVTDLEGNDFILVELAGATEKEARELLAKQGKFEAKVGSQTVFKGGDDITYVCRTAGCSGIDPNVGCNPHPAGGYSCSYFFAISISPEAARKHADITRDLDVVGEPPNEYLTQNLTLWLDDRLVRQLRIGASLRGSETTEIQISGFGTGLSEQDALTNTLDDMKQLQTVLVTGSLPAKIRLVKVDTISPKLGASFAKNAIFMGLLALAAVVIVLLIAYRRLILAIPIVLTSVAEVVIVLGSYALFGWSLDLAAIAGIIVAVGTGVDDQIVIADETLHRGSGGHARGWRERLKRAFFIIMAAYFTSLVAMIPLLFAGAGLLRGFAITTIVGISFGVFVTRPAFAKMIEIFIER